MAAVAAGVALGTLLAVRLSRVMQGLLFEVKATDPLVYLLAAAILAATALLATWLPARRAASLDPMRAMRAE
jgi:putative ABC transport system permease protein